MVETLSLKQIERLASELCWREFSIKPKGRTRVSYWKTVAPVKKDEYREDVRRAWRLFGPLVVRAQEILAVDHNTDTYTRNLNRALIGLGLGARGKP